ncbi:hypothetical protein BaRGS_00000949, partial [Batillaria attramentaria]
KETWHALAEISLPRAEEVCVNWMASGWRTGWCKLQETRSCPFCFEWGISDASRPGMAMNSVIVVPEAEEEQV